MIYSDTGNREGELELDVILVFFEPDTVRVHNPCGRRNIMRISQQLVAKTAGVSRGTVDRVINGKPNVKPETRQRVLNAIEQLRYTPNVNGRALALCNREFSIGVICPGPEVPFFVDVLTGVRDAEEKLRDFNLSIQTVFTHGMCEERIAEEIRSCNAQALMLAAEDVPPVRDAVREMTARSIPVVTFNSDIHDCGRLSFVGQDLYKSGRIAGGLMLKLLRKEHAKVLVITGSQRFQAHKARTDGFSDVISGMGRNVEIVDILETNDERGRTYDVLKRVLSSHPDIEGIYIASGHIEGAVQAIREMRRKYSVIVNDLSPAIENALRDNLFDFTIYQNPYEQGYKPVRLLFDYLLNGTTPVESFYSTGTMVFTREMI